jgi:hypothetical protein
MNRTKLLRVSLLSCLSISLNACLVTEQTPPPDNQPPPDSSNKLILNDTGVDFFLEQNVAPSVDVLAQPSATPSNTAPGQDASTGKDTTQTFGGDGKLGFSFAKLDGTTGEELANDAQSWACVQDKTTGLVWEVKTLAGDHAAGNMYTWYDPTNTNGGDPGIQAQEGDCGGIPFLKGNTYDFIAKINEQQLCGFSDWRLPLREEFRSIIDYGVEQKYYFDQKGRLKYESTAYVDSQYFPNMLQRRHRWTAESSYNEPNKAWAFHPNDGKSEVHPKACTPGGNFTNGIMLVRGPN